MHAAGGNFHTGAPEDGVEDDPAEIIVALVLMIMGAGEPKAPATVGPLDGPHHVLRFTVVLLHLGIATVGIVGAGAAASVVRRNGR